MTRIASVSSSDEDNTALRPPSNMSSSSGNTEESLTAFADTTLRILAANDTSLDISFLPAPAQTSQPEQQGMALIKASVSETLSLDHLEARREIPGNQGTSNRPMKTLRKWRSAVRGIILKQMRERWKINTTALESTDYQTGQLPASLI